MGLSFLTRANFRKKFGDTIREVALSSAIQPEPNRFGAVTGTRVAGVRCRVRRFGQPALAGRHLRRALRLDSLTRMLPDTPTDPRAGWRHVAVRPKTIRTNLRHGQTRRTEPHCPVDSRLQPEGHWQASRNYPVRVRHFCRATHYSVFTGRVLVPPFATCDFTSLAALAMTPRGSDPPDFPGGSLYRSEPTRPMVGSHSLLRLAS
jgi:hypothetical protein